MQDFIILYYDSPVCSFISTYFTFCGGSSKCLPFDIKTGTEAERQAQKLKRNNLIAFFFSPLLLCLGAQTSFTFELPNHKLCFQSKVSPVDMSTMPPSASLTLPPVTMSGEYIMEDHESHSDQAWAPDDFLAKPGNYLQGNYLRCVAEVPTASSRAEWIMKLAIFNLFLPMCRLGHLSTTLPQTCWTTWSSYRRFSWRRSMRSFRRSQVMCKHILGISTLEKPITCSH